MKTRSLVILGVVVLAIVAAAVWFVQNGPTPSVPVASEATPAPVSGNPATASGTPRPVPAPAGTRQAAPVAKNVPPPPMTESELKIDQVLNANANETETAQMLINLLPTLSPDSQAEAAQHITNLIADPDYNRVLPLLRNAALSEDVQSVLFTDLMNRDDPIKLPALLDVAKNPNLANHEEALNDLQIFLDQDDGTNWAQWDTAVKDYLKKQAAEQAADNAPEK